MLLTKLSEYIAFGSTPWSSLLQTRIFYQISCFSTNSLCNFYILFLKSLVISYTYLNTLNLSDSITDNAYLISDPLKTFAEVDILLLVYIYPSSIN